MIRTIFHPSSDEKTFTIERVQDVENIIERNKALQSAPQRRAASFHHIGSIPNLIIEKWLNEERARGNVGIKLFGEEFDRMVERKLRDPDWMWLRTTDKRI